MWSIRDFNHCGYNGNTPSWQISSVREYDEHDPGPKNDQCEQRDRPRQLGEAFTSHCHRLRDCEPTPFRNVPSEYCRMVGSGS